MKTNLYFTAFSTIVIKEVSRFSRIWIQTILPPAVSMTLYFVIFGNLIGPRIGPMDGFSYIQYIAPGIIMMSIINSAYANVVSSFFGAKFQRHIEEMLVAPIPNIVILCGYITGGVARGMMVGFVVTLVALFFTELHIEHPVIVIIVVLLTSILFSLAGLINGIFAKKFDDITIIPTFVLTPLIYLGGVFYSINLLPEFWQMVSKSNPILYMVNAFRYGMLGVSDINIQTAFIIIIIFTTLLFSLCLYLLNRGIGIKS
ncbi:MAG: ABC transporter permease [Candidatus Neomarinimicrobiota bacterium]